MAFMKHGTAMPTKTVNMSSLVANSNIQLGNKVRLGSRTGTVRKITGSMASVVIDGDGEEVQATLSSLTKV